MPRLIYIPKKNNIFPVNYGRLYNWYAATDVRNITNTGWHVPTLTEVNNLLTYLGGASIAGGKLKEIGFTYWGSPNTGATNEVSFNGRGSGIRESGIFSNISIRGYLTGDGGSSRYRFLLSNTTTSISTTVDINQSTRSAGISIRLLKDSTTLSHGQTGTYTGNDGKVYRTICIGSQEWLADNLAEEQYRNGDPIPIVTDNTAWAALTTGGMCSYLNDDNNI